MTEQTDANTRDLDELNLEPGNPVPGWPPASMSTSITSSTGTDQPRRLYLTSELRAAAGLSRTHMDFYLREGIIRPAARTGSGLLLFDDAELETLRVVLRWRTEGAGIKLIRQRLGRAAE